MAEVGVVGYALTIIALVCGIEAVLHDLRYKRAGELDERLYKIALFGGFIALTAIGLVDYYPWALIQMQVAWWGLLAASAHPTTLTTRSIEPTPNATS
jgi:hypothetical protein